MVELATRQWSDRDIYENLAQKAQAHFDETALSKLVSVGCYDPKKETHNPNNVFFEARPNRATPAIFDTIASAVMRSRHKKVKQQVFSPLQEKIEEVVDVLETNKLAIITGHQTLFEPGFALYGLQRVLQRDGRSYEESANNTHLIVARALAPVDFGGRWPLLDLVRQISNVYLTIPRTKNYEDIPAEFGANNNRKMLEAFLKNTRQLGSIAVLSASATTEKRNGDGEYTIEPITEGTAKLLKRGWHILPVGGSFKRNNFEMIPGDIITPNDVDDDSLDRTMRWITKTRNDCGVPTIYKNTA